jgi:hypothetical protein
MEGFGFGEPKQNGFDYPVPLVEKYQPRRMADFIGLEGPKRVFENLLKAPRPVAVLLVGPPPAAAKPPWRWHLPKNCREHPTTSAARSATWPRSTG